MAHAFQFDESAYISHAQNLPASQPQAGLSPTDIFATESDSPVTHIDLDSFGFTSPSAPPPAPTSSTTTPTITTYSMGLNQVSSAVPMPMCNSAAAYLIPSIGIENMLQSEGTDRVESEGDCGSAYDDEDNSQGEGLPEVAKRCPNTNVIENKPKSAALSPEVLNDPAFMQEYQKEKSRLAAKKSRERKKCYVSMLEKTCQALKNHNEELSKELLKMRRELQEIRGKFGRKKSCSIPEGLLAG